MKSMEVELTLFSEKVSEEPETSTKPLLKGYLSSRLATTARLANHIFELVSIYGMSKTLNRRPAIFVEDSKYQKLIDGIQKIFPGLLEKFTILKEKVPTDADQFLLGDICCKFDNPDKLNNRTARHLHLTGHFYQSWRYFDEFQSEILGFVKQLNIDFLLLPKSSNDVFVTCIHVRRTDFVDGEHHSSNVTFTQKALHFIENKEKSKTPNRKMLTVIMGDDPSFEEKMFPNTIRAGKGTPVLNTTKVFVSENTAQNDLIYSRHNCDATLITAPSSTFGWWLGYLSKGQSVYYQDIRSTNDVNYKKGHMDPDDYFPPRWTSINLDGTSGKIVVVGKTS
uniref:L-Fucosyltransferase n=2 Tax=Caenorhabditis japonica TaxID=281687 RepID=A0A8R1E3V4_CAEJA